MTPATPRAWEPEAPALRNGHLDPLTAALAYQGAGLSVIRIATDGSKRPCGPWKPYQQEPATEAQVRTWFDRPDPPGVAVICGAVSGGLETIDFDAEADTIFPSWCELDEAEAPGLVSRLSVSRTPKGGFHVRYRCPDMPIPGNTKLATDPAAKTVLIETRGEGGYALAPGCPAECHPSGRQYVHHSGPPLERVQAISIAERDILIRCARSFDRTPPPEPTKPPPGRGPGLSPGDDYERRGPDWPALLEPHGWVAVHQRGPVTYWRRPGKDGPGWSATTGACTSKAGRELFYVFSANAAPFEAQRGYSKFATYALLNHGGDFSAAARSLAEQGYGEPRRRPAGGRSGRAARPRPGGETAAAEPPPDAPPGECGEGVPGRPEIVITTEEHEVNAAAVVALVTDQGIYQRGGMLARIVRDVSPAAKGIRRPFATRIEPLPPPLLRERLAANASWMTLKGDALISARPPAWCVAAVHARGNWPDIRHLEAVVDYPVLRPDGTILDRAGYDPDTGLLLEAAAPFPVIPQCPSKDQAIAARDQLLEVVADFPFERAVHRAAWLAALLSPLARFAFTGPAPLFLVDSNVRAAGKGLLLDTISRVVTGERFTVATYTGDEDELRKRITSLVLAGDRLVLFDNLEGKFGNAVLDAALTGTAWKDRVLGASRMAEAPLYMTWYATGNNVAIAADTARRICHVRLESPHERPEERQGFRHPDLLAWVGQHRADLLAAALTILRGYCAAGRPDQRLPAWGSFEGWSGLVRSAVVWVGLPDPGETRLLLQAQADVAAESMGIILACWERLDPDRKGLTSADVVGRLKDTPPDAAPDYYADLRDALEALLGKLDARALGNKLRSYRRRIFGGRFIDQAGTEQRAARWAVYPAEAFRRRPDNTHQTHHTHPRPGESGESGESLSAVPGSAEGPVSDDVEVI